MRTGGLALNTLKKLKGDRLGVPSASTVLANAIGLGPTAPSKYPCNLGVGRSDGVIEISSFMAYKNTQIEGSRKAIVGGKKHNIFLYFELSLRCI